LLVTRACFCIDRISLPYCTSPYLWGVALSDGILPLQEHPEWVYLAFNDAVVRAVSAKMELSGEKFTSS
jgi:hypothetical protein